MVRRLQLFDSHISTHAQTRHVDVGNVMQIRDISDIPFSKHRQPVYVGTGHTFSGSS